MHETEKQKINLIYNHNFQEKFDFLLCRKRNGNQNYTKSFKGEFQAKMQDSILLPGKAYSNPTSSNLTN